MATGRRLRLPIEPPARPGPPDREPAVRQRLETTLRKSFDALTQFETEPRDLAAAKSRAAGRQIDLDVTDNPWGAGRCFGGGDLLGEALRRFGGAARDLAAARSRGSARTGVSASKDFRRSSLALAYGWFAVGRGPGRAAARSVGGVDDQLPLALGGLPVSARRVSPRGRPARLSKSLVRRGRQGQRPGTTVAVDCEMPGADLVDAEALQVVVQVIPVPTLRQPLPPRHGLRQRERGSGPPLVSHLPDRRKWDCSVQHSHERLAAADQHLVWLPDTWLFVQLTQRSRALTSRCSVPSSGRSRDPLAASTTWPFQAVWVGTPDLDGRLAMRGQ